MLAGAQLAVTWLSVRSTRYRSWVKAEPTILVEGGIMLSDAMKRERVTPDEVEAAVRGAGFDGVNAVALVVLETDGSMSVVSRKNALDPDRTQKHE